MSQLINLFPKNRKGVSPIIATVLLIAMVIVMGLIIFLWFRGFNESAITKLEKNVELVCDDVIFSADYDSSSNRLSIVNDGTVSIFNMNIKILKPGSHETKNLMEDYNGWPETGLSQGGVTSEISISLDNDVKEIILIPILAGKSDKGDRVFTCKEQNGIKISIT